jgi:Mg/Co/Ni transporter MgtE
MTDEREPANEWATKKELIKGSIIGLILGFLSLSAAIFTDIGAPAIISTALFFFLLGVGSAPLFYKFWFKRNN